MGPSLSAAQDGSGDLEALNRLDDDEKHTVRALIESILLRHEARHLARTS